MRRLHEFYRAGGAAIVVAFILAGLLASCAGTRQVTVGGVPTTSETTQQAANRIYNAETAYVLAGESLLVLREAGEIDDAIWAQIADASDDVATALMEARAALIEYEGAQNDVNATKLSKSLTAIDYIGRRLLTYAGEE